MDPIVLLGQYYSPDGPLYEMLLAHGRAVAQKALRIAEGLSWVEPDMVFLEEASLLHDIGIRFVSAPSLGCFGSRPYLCHGYLGRELLEEEGLFRHALVCERHVGVGLTALEVRARRLPLPERDMLPLTLEEQIICYADKFFSKSRGSTDREKPLEEVRSEIRRYGEEKLRIFDRMTEVFSP